MNPLTISRLPCLRAVFTVFFCATLSIEAHSAVSKNMSFIDQSVEVPYPLTMGVIAGNFLPDLGKELLTFSLDENKKRWLMIYSYDVIVQKYIVTDKTMIPRRFHSFDIGQSKQVLATKALQKIYFFSSSGLYEYQQGEFIQRAVIKSLYLEPEAAYLRRGDFVHDLNNDTFDDVIVNNFSQTVLLIGGDDNQFFRQVLPVKPQMSFEQNTISFTPVTLFFADVNFDDRTDIARAGEGDIGVYLQLENGQFNETAETISINALISSLEWWSKRDESGEQLDQTKLESRMLDALRDLNGDGIADMVVKYSKALGVLDRANDYEIYLGKKVLGKLVFGEQPSSVIRADGVLTGLEFSDIDNDDILEVLLVGFDIGLTQIIGALVSGSIDQDVYVFKMNGASSYGRKPIFRKKVDLNFSLSSGQTGTPVVKLGDVNGDGLKDLILSVSDNRLRIYYGKSDSKIFTKRSVSYKTHLPSDGDLVSVNDLNYDGKDDLLMSFSAADEQGRIKTFKVLLAR